MNQMLLLLLPILAGCDEPKRPQQKVDAPAVQNSSDQVTNELLFRGYSCTSDCSGHEAGYAWAEEQGISDPDDCGGNSLSFEEGCRAYAEEQ